MTPPRRPVPRSRSASPRSGAARTGPFRERHRRRGVVGLAALVGLGLALGPAPATAAGPGIVVDVASGAVLHSEAALAPWYPASLAKLMTLYLAFEALDDGTLTRDETLVVSAAAAGQPAVRLGLAAGAQITADEAIAATAVASANDAAVVLAERLAGSEAVFAKSMSERARTLGLADTVFANASGLPGAGQRTTARDMAVLARRLLEDFPAHYGYFARREMVHAGASHPTVNGLLGAFPGADGLKTGFTCDAGYNLVASAVRDGRRLVAVVLGEPNRAARTRRTVTLLDEGFGAPLPPGAAILETVLPAPGTPSTEPAPRLGSEECTRGTGNGRAGTGRLPGHGLLIGVFATEREARAAAARALGLLRGVAGGARPVYLPRTFERGRSFKTVLVGLDQTAAGRACQALWQAGLVCVPQSPALMNTPNYARR